MPREPLPPAVEVLLLFAAGAWAIYTARIAYRDPERARNSYWLRPQWTSKSNRIMRAQSIAGLWFGSLLILTGIAFLSSAPRSGTTLAVVLALSILSAPLLVPRLPRPKRKTHR